MYAVIETGGKQYRVRAGDIIEIEKIEGEVGAPVKFDRVLLLSQGGATESPQVWIGKPTVAQASVTGQVVAQGRGEKIIAFKMTRRAQYRRTVGHRQELSQVIVTAVDSGAGAREALSAADTEAKLSKFYTQLTPKGPARVGKTLGSREWLRRISAPHKPAPKKAEGHEGEHQHTEPKAKKAAAPKKAAAAKSKAHKPAKAAHGAKAKSKK